MGDIIKKPDHYCEGREYEPKDVIRDWGLNFNLGSSVKYISRAGRKGDKLEDLKKAKQFLQFEIEAVEKSTSADICANAIVNGTMKIEDVPKSLKSLVVNRLAEKEAEKNYDESELDIYCRGFNAGYDMAHTDLRSVEDTFTISFKVEED